MINYNRKTKVLSIKFNRLDSIAKYNSKLSKINSNLSIFIHENEYRLVDNLGKFHKLNKEITIKL